MSTLTLSQRINRLAGILTGNQPASLIQGNAPAPASRPAAAAASKLAPLAAPPASTPAILKGNGIDPVLALAPALYGNLPGILPQSVGQGGLPAAFEFLQVYRITVGEKTAFSTRSPGFALTVWDEITTRPLMQKPEGGEVRLRDCLVQHMGAAAKAASTDLVAAINCPAVVLDGLMVSANWNGHGLSFEIVTGIDDKWRFVTGNPNEAAIVFEECKRANVACEVAATFNAGSRRLVWLKTGLTAREIRVQEWEARQSEAAKKEALRLVAQAEQAASKILQRATRASHPN